MTKFFGNRIGAVMIGGFGRRHPSISKPSITVSMLSPSGFGLIRLNSKFKPARGERLDFDEDMLPESFDQDHADVREALSRIERFRLLLIDLNNPVDD